MTRNLRVMMSSESGRPISNHLLELQYWRDPDGYVRALRFEAVNHEPKRLTGMTRILNFKEVKRTRLRSHEYTKPEVQFNPQTWKRVSA